MGSISKVISHPDPELQNNCKKHKMHVCVCSPTNHPGSFRCSLHRGIRIGAKKTKGDRQQALMVAVKPPSNEKGRCGNFQLQVNPVVSCAENL